MERNHSPRDPSDQLLDIKKRFQASLLEDEACFAVVKERLFDSSEDGADLPSFSIEPTLARDETSQSTLGFRMTKSREYEKDEFGSELSLYDYLQIGLLDRESGILTPSPELLGLLASAGLQKQDAIKVAQMWQSGSEMIVKEMSDQLTIDPMTHTFELGSEVDNVNYAVEA